MTNKQREQIFFLRQSGQGYKSISTSLGLSRDEVRNFCRNHGMEGYGEEIKQNIAESLPAGICKFCGEQLILSPIGRPKLYCSAECKRKWEKAHPKFYSHKCEHCEKKFQSISSKQKFCSRNCYIRDRFWREEDAQDIMNKLLNGKEVISVPKWLKNLLQ